MLEDHILLRRSKHGDRSAFDRIYQKYLDALLTVAMSLLGNAGDAEDVVQEVFASFVGSLDTFRLRGNLGGFLAVCVANQCRDVLRKRNRPATDGRASAKAAHASEPLELVIHDEQVRCIQNALSRLPYEQREVVTLHVHAGLTFRAVARALKIPLGTVQSRYRYGLNSLKTQLNGEDHP